jgi:hypothetical protein
MAGRTSPYRMLAGFTIPPEFPVPTCDHCGAIYLDEQTSAELYQVMHAAFLKELRRRGQQAIGEICKHVSQRRLEFLLGLSAGYLSRLRAGGGNPSSALVALLTLLARDPDTRLRELGWIWRDLKPGEHEERGP